MARRKESTSADYGGFVLTFEPERTQWLRERIYPEAKLSESFSALDWEFEPRELVFLILSHEPFRIHGFALMERMHGSGGVGKAKMRMTKPLVVFEEPISGDEASIDLSLLVSTSERLKRVPSHEWNRLVSAVLALRPAHADQIEETIAKRTQQRRLLETGQRELRLNEQRDGLGVALDIGNLDRAGIFKTMNADAAGNALSVLDLLDGIRTQERSLLEHDRRIFEMLIGSQPARSAAFDDGSGNSVRVTVTDRDDLESVLGIDLVIYQQRYESFLLLQYKRMSRTADSWAYAIPPTANLHEQLHQIGRFKRAAAQEENSLAPTLWSYRLNQEPFFFKFCEEQRPTANDASLIRGITMPAEHLLEFLALDKQRGDRGGRYVGYQNCPRYLTNTEFIQLARSGWIGAGRQAARMMGELLAANRRGGRQAMLAVIEQPAEPSASRRGRRVANP
jgi:hypothetical protein